MSKSKSSSVSLTDIPMMSVSSSQIKSVGYSGNVMIIEFLTGSKYLYAGVSEDKYKNMMISESVGSYFSRNIKNDSNVICIKL